MIRVRTMISFTHDHAHVMQFLKHITSYLCLHSFAPDIDFGRYIFFSGQAVLFYEDTLPRWVVSLASVPYIRVQNICMYIQGCILSRIPADCVFFLIRKINPVFDQFCTKDVFERLRKLSLFTAWGGVGVQKTLRPPHVEQILCDILHGINPFKIYYIPNCLLKKL